MLGLVLGKPVPGAGALHFGPGHVADALGGCRVEQAVIGGLLSQLAQGREALVDGGRRQAAGLEVGPVLLHGGADEGRPALVLPPAEELPDRVAVHGAGERTRDGVEHQLLDGLEGVGGRQVLINSGLEGPL